MKHKSKQKNFQDILPYCFSLFVFVFRNIDLVFDHTREMKLYSGCNVVSNQTDYRIVFRNSFENYSKLIIPLGIHIIHKMEQNKQKKKEQKQQSELNVNMIKIRQPMKCMGTFARHI